LVLFPAADTAFFPAATSACIKAAMSGRISSLSFITGFAEKANSQSGIAGSGAKVLSGGLVM
jgi:hypothetical protein